MSPAQAYSPTRGTIYQPPADQHCLKGRGNCAIYNTTTGVPTLAPGNDTRGDSGAQILAHRTWDGVSTSWSAPGRRRHRHDLHLLVGPDADRRRPPAGASLTIEAPTASGSQDWQFVQVAGVAGTHSVVGPASGRCLDVPNHSTAASTQVDIWDRNSGNIQRWTAAVDGTLRGVQSGLCLDAPTTRRRTARCCSCTPATAARTRSGASAEHLGTDRPSPRQPDPVGGRSGATRSRWGCMRSARCRAGR
jgi:hypothetical protein